MNDKLEIWINETPNTFSIQLTQSFFNSLKIALRIITGRRINFKSKKIIWNTKKEAKKNE